MSDVGPRQVPEGFMEILLVLMFLISPSVCCALYVGYKIRQALE